MIMFDRSQQSNTTEELPSCKNSLFFQSLALWVNEPQKKRSVVFRRKITSLVFTSKSQSDETILGQRKLSRHSWFRFHLLSLCSVSWIASRSHASVSRRVLEKNVRNECKRTKSVHVIIMVTINPKVKGFSLQWKKVKKRHNCQSLSSCGNLVKKKSDLHSCIKQKGLLLELKICGFEENDPGIKKSKTHI